MLALDTPAERLSRFQRRVGLPVLLYLVAPNEDYAWGDGLFTVISERETGHGRIWIVVILRCLHPTTLPMPQSS